MKRVFIFCVKVGSAAASSSVATAAVSSAAVSCTCSVATS